MSAESNKASLIQDTQHLFEARGHDEVARQTPTIVGEAGGIRVTDVEGRSFMDGLSGIWTVNIGHGNRAVIEAMTEQLQRFSFSWPEGTLSEPAIRLGQLLAEITPPVLTTALLVNSGSVDTEATLKLARQYWLHRGHPRKTKILSRYLSWHGSTMGALSMGGTTPWKEPFGPFLGECRHVPPPYCYRCPYGLTHPACDLACARVIENVIEWEDPETVAAIILDPVMVSAGILVPPEGYLATVRDICQRTGTLLIFDEVITGFGRTGEMFAMDTFGVVPDVVALAKGMSSGYAPLAGIVAAERVAAEFWGEDKAFRHGHTFGGNPVSATAGVANITQILEGGLVNHARRVGAHLQQQGQELLRQSLAGDVRGVGLILGAELVADRERRTRFPAEVAPGLRIQASAKRRGLLLRASPNWIALAPPLITTKSEIDEMLGIVQASIKEVQAQVLL